MKRIIILLMMSISMMVYTQTKVDLDKFKINNNIPDGEAGIIALNQYPEGLEIIVKSRKPNPIKLSIKFYDASYNEKRVDIYVDSNAISKQIVDGINIDNVAEVMKDKTEDVDCNGKTAIADYAREGNMLGVFCSLSNGVNIETTSAGYTALINATFDGHLEIIRYLLSKGADINAKAKYSFSGYPTGTTACIIASNKGFQEIKDLVCK